MRASIIITTYNRPHFLKRAIDSCLSQVTDFEYEIIVVDDNGLNTESQIESHEIIKEYESLIYIPLKENSGACIARNIGVDVAKGDYIFFLDDDDEFLPNKIQVQVNYLEDNHVWDGILAAFKRIDQNTNKEIIADSNYPKVGAFKNFAIQGNFFTPMLCIRREAMVNIGGFDTIDRFQDRFFLLKALINGLKFNTSNEKLHIMYEHQDSRITEASITKSINSLDKLYALIAENRKEFSMVEWRQFLKKDYRVRGTLYYVSKQYKVRLQAIPYFMKAFLISKSIVDLKMILKSIIKIN